jgi:hypothetical protein
MLKTHPKAKALIGKLPPLAVLQIFLQKVPPPIPVGNHCPVANRHVFAPRHGPLVWHCSLKSCPLKPINKAEILKAETHQFKRWPDEIWSKISWAKKAETLPGEV